MTAGNPYALLPVRLVRLGMQPAVETQAVYHALARTMTPDAPDTVVLTWPAAPYLCLGYHQTAGQVLDRAAAEGMGLPVVRRRVGGGLTHLDSHQVFYQFVFHRTRAPAVPRDLYAYALAAPLDALGRLGVAARLERTNEIEVNRRRIAGIGAGQIGQASVVVGNLLLDFDYGVLPRVWHCPSRDFRDLAGRSLLERVTTLRREGLPATQEQAEAALIAGLAATLGRPLVEGALTEPERRATIEQTARLTNPEFVGWQQGPAAARAAPLKISARAFVHAVSAELAGYRVDGALLTDEDVIVAARLSSRPARDWRHAEAALAGQACSDWSRYLPV